MNVADLLQDAPSDDLHRRRLNHLHQHRHSSSLDARPPHPHSHAPVPQHSHASPLPPPPSHSLTATLIHPQTPPVQHPPQRYAPPPAPAPHPYSDHPHEYSYNARRDPMPPPISSGLPPPPHGYSPSYEYRDRERDRERERERGREREMREHGREREARERERERELQHRNPPPLSSHPSHSSPMYLPPAHQGPPAPPPPVTGHMPHSRAAGPFAQMPLHEPSPMYTPGPGSAPPSRRSPEPRRPPPPPSSAAPEPVMASLGPGPDRTPGERAGNHHAHQQPLPPQPSHRNSQHQRMNALASPALHQPPRDRERERQPLPPPPPSRHVSYQPPHPGSVHRDDSAGPALPRDRRRPPPPSPIMDDEHEMNHDYELPHRSRRFDDVVHEHRRFPRPPASSSSFAPPPAPPHVHALPPLPSPPAPPPVTPKPVAVLGIWTWPSTPFPYAFSERDAAFSLRAVLLFPSHALPSVPPERPRVWGGAAPRRVYTDDSDILAASVHSGAVTWSALARAREAGKDVRVDLAIVGDVVRYSGGVGARARDSTQQQQQQLQEYGHRYEEEDGEGEGGDVEDDGRGIMSASWGNGHDGAGFEVVGAALVPGGTAHSGRRNRKQRLAEYTERRLQLMPPQKKRKKLAEEKENEIAGVAVGKRSALELELDARPTIVLGAGGGWTGHVFRYDPATLRAALFPSLPHHDRPRKRSKRIHEDSSITAANGKPTLSTSTAQLQSNNTQSCLENNVFDKSEEQQRTVVLETACERFAVRERDAKWEIVLLAKLGKAASAAASAAASRAVSRAPTRPASPAPAGALSVHTPKAQRSLEQHVADKLLLAVPSRVSRATTPRPSPLASQASFDALQFNLNASGAEDEEMLELATDEPLPEEYPHSRLARANFAFAPDELRVLSAPDGRTGARSGWAIEVRRWWVEKGPGAGEGEKNEQTKKEIGKEPEGWVEGKKGELSVLLTEPASAGSLSSSSTPLASAVTAHGKLTTVETISGESSTAEPVPLSASSDASPAGGKVNEHATKLSNGDAGTHREAEKDTGSPNTSTAALPPTVSVSSSVAVSA